MKSRGFTLIELIIVIIVMGIIAITVVNVKWTNAPKLNAFAHRLASNIRYVQNLAITRHEAYRLTFSTGQMALTSGDGLTAESFPATGSNLVTLPSGITATFSGLSTNMLIYNADGIPYTDAAMTTQLTSDATITLTQEGHSVTIAISGITGMALKPA